MRIFLIAVLALLPMSSAMAQPTNPAGIWRCVVNSNIVSIDMTYQINPDFSLAGQGSIVYIATSRIYQVQGYGRWSASPPDASSNQWLYRLQIAPQNHAMFSVFPRPTNDPNFMNNVFQDPQTGGVTETSCQRIG